MIQIGKVKTPVTWEVKRVRPPDHIDGWMIQGSWNENGRRWTTGERTTFVKRERDVKPTLARLRRECGDYVWVDAFVNVVACQ